MWLEQSEPKGTELDIRPGEKRSLQLYLVWYEKAVGVLRRVEMLLDTDAVTIIIIIILPIKYNKKCSKINFKGS